MMKWVRKVFIGKSDAFGLVPGRGVKKVFVLGYIRRLVLGASRPQPNAFLGSISFSFVECHSDKPSNIVRRDGQTETQLQLRWALAPIWARFSCQTHIWNNSVSLDERECKSWT